jgi:hypothetical protein
VLHYNPFTGASRTGKSFRASIFETDDEAQAFFEQRCRERDPNALAALRRIILGMSRARG